MKKAGDIDSWPFVWKDLAKYGYTSLYAEDNPGIGAFTLRLKGWNKQPTDHFFVPFWFGHGRYNKYPKLILFSYLIALYDQVLENAKKMSRISLVNLTGLESI